MSLNSEIQFSGAYVHRLFQKSNPNFHILLTVHLGIILVIDQLNAQILVL